MISVSRIVVFLVITMTSFIHANDLLWSQEFDEDGPLDETVWNYDLGNSGWGNWELQNYTRDNVAIHNHQLVIQARTENGQFTSSRINTLQKFAFQYGTVEVSIKVPNLADGLWPAVWFLGNNYPNVKWPDCGEIDLLEMGSKDAITSQRINQRVGSTAHWEHEGQHAHYGLSYDHSAPLDDGHFHNLTLTWTPTMISTYMDSHWIWSMDIFNPDNFDGHEFHLPFALIINMAVGGTYTGLTAPEQVTANFPASLVVDYVRVYRNPYTTNVLLPTSTPVTTSLRTRDVPAGSNGCSDLREIGATCQRHCQCRSDFCRGRLGSKTCHEASEDRGRRQRQPQ